MNMQGRATRDQGLGPSGLAFSGTPWRFGNTEFQPADGKILDWETCTKGQCRTGSILPMWLAGPQATTSINMPNISVESA